MLFFPMSILSWNCRGAAHPDFNNDIAELVLQHNPMLIFILETRLAASKAEDLKIRLRFDKVYGIDSNGLSGGIWMLWDSERISVDILPHGSQSIHALVQDPSQPDPSSANGACVSRS